MSSCQKSIYKIERETMPGEFFPNLKIPFQKITLSHQKTLYRYDNGCHLHQISEPNFPYPRTPRKTQRYYALKGELTPEMEFVLLREDIAAKLKA